MVRTDGRVARRRAETRRAKANAPFPEWRGPSRTLAIVGARSLPLGDGGPTPFLRERFEAPGCEGNVRVLWP